MIRRMMSRDPDTPGEWFQFARVIAYCDPRNVASERVMLWLGMRREGHMVESMWAKGEWTDDLIYALLEREWRQRA